MKERKCEIDRVSNMQFCETLKCIPIYPVLSEVMLLIWKWKRSTSDMFPVAAA